MTPMRPPRRQGLPGPDIAMSMGQPAPMQFAPPPPMPTSPDATGAQAIGGLANLATALMNRPAGPGPSPTDAPQRRKTPFTEAANYA